jgi:hypothetical protein
VADQAAGLAAQAYGAAVLQDGRTRLAWARPDDSAALADLTEREAAEIRRQASAQSAAIQAAAEREAAELRAAVAELLAGLAGAGPVAGELGITERPGPVRPAAALPAAALPAAAPSVARPRGRPRTGSPGRQARAMREVVIAFAVLSLAGLASGAAEAELHGFRFFLFRNAGAGGRERQEPRRGPGPRPAGGAGLRSRSASPAARSRRLALPVLEVAAER